jgi:hypothetical protein
MPPIFLFSNIEKTAAFTSVLRVRQGIFAAHPEPRAEKYGGLP